MKRFSSAVAVLSAAASVTAASLSYVQALDVADPDAQGYTGVYYQPGTGFLYAAAVTGDGQVLYAADPAQPGLVGLYDTATGTFREIHAVDAAEGL